MLCSQGAVAYWRGDVAGAAALLAEGLALADELGAKDIRPRAVIYQAHLALRQGDTAAAAALYLEVLHHCRESKALYLVPYALEGYAWALHDADRAERTARLFGAASAVRELSKAGLAAREQRDRERRLQIMRGLLGPAGFERAFAAGWRLAPRETIVLALEAAPGLLLDNAAPATGESKAGH